MLPLTIIFSGASETSDVGIFPSFLPNFSFFTTKELSFTSFLVVLEVRDFDKQEIIAF